MALDVRTRLLEGLVIPAHPLALDAERRLDARRQRALTRYYLDAGAGGVAVGVHTTQFAIRDPGVDLYRPVLQLAADSVRAHERAADTVLVAGIVGETPQALHEAATARDLGYHVGLVSLGGLDDYSIDDLVAHVRAVADVLPVMGFYLQPAVGGRPLPYAFWRRLCDVDRLVAIKIAPFDRHRTLDVVRAVADAGRARDVALYTGNDDHIVLDLLTPFLTGDGPPVHMVGGLLGQWAVWTRRAVEIHAECRRVVTSGTAVPRALLTLAHELTDANGAIFDAANGYAGCLPGIHEVLRRQGLLAGTWCLREDEVLSPGQLDEIERVLARYPHLADDAFVAERRDRWLA
ncbi:MAG: dihydrodipicolinate synthase family protein [Gemmatimonadales bacterium]|jgi:dihydrodipicolinate synthase/N-acetylneuraminate lyase